MWEMQIHRRDFHIAAYIDRVGVRGTAQSLRWLVAYMVTSVIVFHKLKPGTFDVSHIYFTFIFFFNVYYFSEREC